MACDYPAIRRDNERCYGTEIGRIGPMLLANRYDDRTHFIFELLQNAEDALARRHGWRGSRSVCFRLNERALHVSHFGKPFDENDVRGICGIGETTKDLTAIGRFGIGFKSVYAFTDCPEIHSGTEDFAIESYVWPVAVQPLVRNSDQTVILIPLRASDETGPGEIAVGLGQLGASVLLFLREIDEIEWRVEGGSSGQYLRESKEIDEMVRRVSVVGQERGKDEVGREWLVFSRPVTTEGGHQAGYVEIAFSLGQDRGIPHEHIRRVERSRLVVFFPTVLETHLGGVVQGPYRTTPSRDNVPQKDPWNQRLVNETASLLVEALRWLRYKNLLDTMVLQCLPLDPTQYPEGSMFRPLFDATKRALFSEPLLPRFDQGHVPASCARLARTQDIRELITPVQLKRLFRNERDLYWLSGDITQDRTPDLRRYLVRELDIGEVTPETVVARLDKLFLEDQPDDWILSLYQFLSTQPALRREVSDLPVVRLENGTHVVANRNSQPQAFLPGAIKTGFPTVRASVCTTEIAREFLESLGLTEPDPVDDVIRNVLPTFNKSRVDLNDADYEAEIERILTAFATDSKKQREKLVAALRQTFFVKVVDARDGSKRLASPDEAYVATERLKALFTGVHGVLLVDETYACLRGEGIRDLLEACGGGRYLQPVTIVSTLDWEQLREMRLSEGCERLSYAEPIQDQTLRGLDGLLALLPQIDFESRRKKTALLWETLGEVEDRRGTGVFLGSYTWFYYNRRHRMTFDADFVRKLNATAWVPDRNGELQRPEFIVFDTLGWKPNPFLESKICFKPPIIETLAREVGIEPGVLDLLKKLGVTSEAQLRDRLGMKDEPVAVDAAPPGKAPDSMPPVQAPGGSQTAGGAGSAGPVAPVSGTGKTEGGATRSATRGREFISYVAVHPDEEEPDPDGVDQSARMELEARAIDFILSQEPTWQRTPTHNPGYDLFESDEHGKPTRWCEVKAMASSLRDRPVGLSRTQFEEARELGPAYWLYVVEHAGTDHAHIVRIQDPAGKARTFTFDRGWVNVASVDSK